MRRPITAALALSLSISACVAAPVAQEVSPTEIIVQRACALDPDILRRIERGREPARSEDVTTVPAQPNYLGSFDVISHSGPWDYLQHVPLIVYLGPAAALRGHADTPVTLADIYPTVGKLLGVALEERDGRVLDPRIESSARGPRLIVVVMWDGVGVNVLRRWPYSWPQLASLQEQSLTYDNATVGSSPSITPATHATLGTGTFPARHGVSAIQFRDGDTISVSFDRLDPKALRLTTFADQVDRAFANESKVGTIAWRTWHLPMMGSGAAVPGGDRDQVGIIGARGIVGDNEFYATPPYLRHLPGLEKQMQRLDREDGVGDRRWLGHVILDDQDSPAWIRYQTQVIMRMLEEERYGRDRIPDLFFTNYKMTDIVGHKYSMDSAEMEVVLREQDEALGQIVDHLDKTVRDYALILSADHGHTPSPERSGGWPISQDELERDLNTAFDVPRGSTLTQAITAVGPFLDRRVMGEVGVTEVDVATFLNAYTIRDNWPRDDLPEGYEDRGDEPIFSAAFPGTLLPRIRACTAEN